MTDGELKKRIREQTEPSVEMRLRGVRAGEFGETVVELKNIEKVLDEAKAEWIKINKVAGRENFWMEETLLARSKWFERWFGSAEK